MKNTKEVKEKKPFYKKKWFAALAIIVVLGAVGGAFGSDSESSKTAENDTSIVSETNTNRESIVEAKAVESKEAASEETDASGFTMDDHVNMMTISQQIMDRYLTGYKTPWSDKDWVFAKFDDEGAVMVTTDLEVKDTSLKQDMICIFTYDPSDPDNVMFTEHFLSVGNQVLSDDGYADEFFANLNSVFSNGNN